MKKFRIVTLLTTLLLLMSCSSVSPFVSSNREYTTLPAVFGEDDELVVLIKTKELPKKFMNRDDNVFKNADFFSISLSPKGIVGALEGKYVADGIRYFTGSNRAEIASLNVYQPDGGVFIFTNGDVKEANSFLIDNRNERIDKKTLQKRFDNAVSIFGNNISRDMVKKMFNIDDMNFNKIDITLNGTNLIDFFMMNGEIVFESNEKLDRFVSLFKPWYVGEMRLENAKFNESQMDKSITTKENRLSIKNMLLPINSVKPFIYGEVF